MLDLISKVTQEFWITKIHSTVEFSNKISKIISCNNNFIKFSKSWQHGYNIKYFNEDWRIMSLSGILYAIEDNYYICYLWKNIQKKIIFRKFFLIDGDDGLIEFLSIMENQDNLLTKIESSI